MYNPCHTCIIKVNCTEVCFEKTNYKTLLDNAISNFTGSHNGNFRRGHIVLFTLSNSQRNQYYNYLHLKKENEHDLTNIRIRRDEKAGIISDRNSI